MQHFNASFAARGWEGSGSFFYRRNGSGGTLTGYIYQEDRYEGTAHLYRQTGAGSTAMWSGGIDPNAGLVIEVIGLTHRLIQGGVVLATVTDATYGATGTYGADGMPVPVMTQLTYSISAGTSAAYSGSYHVGDGVVSGPMYFDLRMVEVVSGDGWSGSYATGEADVDGNMEFDLTLGAYIDVVLEEPLDVAATGEGWSGSYATSEAVMSGSMEFDLLLDDGVVPVPLEFDLLLNDGSTVPATGEGHSGSYAEGDAYDGWDLIIDSPMLTSPFVDATVVGGTTYQYRALIDGEWVYSEEVLFVGSGEGIPATGNGYSGSYAAGDATVVDPTAYDYIDVVLEAAITVPATGDGFSGSYATGEAFVVTPDGFLFIDVVLEADPGAVDYEYIDVILTAQPRAQYNGEPVDGFLYNGVESTEWIFIAD